MGSMWWRVYKKNKKIRLKKKRFAFTLIARQETGMRPTTAAENYVTAQLFEIAGELIFSKNDNHTFTSCSGKPR